MSGNSVMKQVYYKVSQDKRLKKSFKNLHKRIKNFHIGSRPNRRGRSILNKYPCLQGYVRGKGRTTTFYVKIKGVYWEIVEHSRWNTMFKTRDEAVAYSNAVNNALDNQHLLYFNSSIVPLKEHMRISELSARVKILEDTNTMLANKEYDQLATKYGEIYHNPNRKKLQFDVSNLANVTLAVSFDNGKSISKFKHIVGTRREYTQKVLNKIMLNRYTHNNVRQATIFKNSVKKALDQWSVTYIGVGGDVIFASDYTLVVDYSLKNLSATKLAILAQYELKSIFDNRVEHAMLKQAAITVFGYNAKDVTVDSDGNVISVFKQNMLGIMQFLLEFVVPPKHNLFKTMSKRYFSSIVLDSITYPYKEFDWRYK